MADEAVDAAKQLHDLPEGFFYVARQFQDAAPYTPLTTRQFQQAVLRQTKNIARPHVARRLLKELYVEMSGQYGVETVTDTVALEASFFRAWRESRAAALEKKRTREDEGNADFAPSSAPAGPGAAPGSAPGRPRVVVMAAAEPSMGATGQAAGAPKPATTGGDYRAQALKKAQERVLAYKNAPCRHFNTTVGCQRGSQCPYAHIQQQSGAPQAATALLQAALAKGKGKR